MPDPRLARIAAVMDPPPRKVVPATVQFVDIAGLVKGASQGEGLGNKSWRTSARLTRSCR